jgi:hypothetical protein
MLAGEERKEGGGAGELEGSRPRVAEARVRVFIGEQVIIRPIPQVATWSSGCRVVRRRQRRERWMLRWR